jgi:hypothetical protein
MPPTSAVPVTADHTYNPLPIPLLFLPNFLPIFLYDFIGILLEIVYGMVIGVLGW